MIDHPLPMAAAAMRMRERECENMKRMANSKMPNGNRGGILRDAHDTKPRGFISMILFFLPISLSVLVLILGSRKQATNGPFLFSLN